MTGAAGDDEDAALVRAFLMATSTYKIEGMRSTLVSVFLLALLVVPGVAAAPKTAAPAPARRLPLPEQVSARDRQALEARLGPHAQSMQDLVRAGVLLDRPTIESLAGRIADEKTFTPSATLHVAILSDLQAEGQALAAAARELAFAATTRSNDAVLADRFAVLTRTCVSCHSAYLHPPRRGPPIDLGLE